MLISCSPNLPRVYIRLCKHGNHFTFFHCCIVVLVIHISKQSYSLPPQALHYLVLISEVEETEIFKICLEYWNALASDLYRENPFPSSTPLLIGSSQSQTIPPRRQMYLSVLSKVSKLLLPLALVTSFSTRDSRNINQADGKLIVTLIEKLLCGCAHRLHTYYDLSEFWTLKGLIFACYIQDHRRINKSWFIWWYVILFTIIQVFPCYLFMTYLGTADYDCKDGQTRRGEKICGMLIESRWSTTFFFFIYSKQHDGKMSMHAPHLQKIDAWKGMGMMIFPHYWGKMAASLKFHSLFSQLGLPSIVKFLSNLQRHLSHSTKKALC